MPMLAILAVSSIETLVTNNLALFAIGHVGLVMVLLVLFFNLNPNPNRNPKESNVRDEDAFDYGTEDGSLFRSHTEGSNAIKAMSERPTLPPTPKRSTLLLFSIPKYTRNPSRNPLKLPNRNLRHRPTKPKPWPMP
jgi:hypothetical protein